MSKRLEKEVWALDRCCGCGNCVALCAKGVLSWNGEEHPTLEVREKALGLSLGALDTCSFCPRFCEAACPRLEDEWPALDARRLVSVRTKGIVTSGEPDEVIKHLLVAAMAAGLIDGAIVPDMDPWKLEPRATVATSVGGVVDTLGASYLWVPVLSALNEAVYEKGLESVAVVGTPCASQALRKVAAPGEARLEPYRGAVRLRVASFCAGVYLPELVNGYLAGEMGVEAHDVKRLMALPREDRLVAALWDGTTRTVSLADVEGYTRRGCARCDDYLGESADVAVGTLGAPEGYCTVIARTRVGEICLHTALNLGLLETGGEVDRQALQRAAKEKERRQRAQAFDSLMLMMLDALGEPQKRADVKRAFVQLYQVKKPAELRKEEANSHVVYA